MPEYAVNSAISREGSSQARHDGAAARAACDRRAYPRPRPEGCRKLVGSDGAFRIRVGDYRVIYTVDDAILIVAIENIRHRREAYR